MDFGRFSYDRIYNFLHSFLWFIFWKPLMKCFNFLCEIKKNPTKIKNDPPNFLNEKIETSLLNNLNIALGHWQQ